MPKLVLTEGQKEAVGKLVADNFGANFQTGQYAGHDDWAYVAWQVGPNTGTQFAYIGPDGRVTYA